MSRTSDELKLKQLKEKYGEVIYNFNVKKADGNLSKLCNLNDTFDETFDMFYDEYKRNFEEIHGEWPSNEEIEKTFNDKQLRKCISFYEQYIKYLESEITREGESTEGFVYLEE